MKMVSSVCNFKSTIYAIMQEQARAADGRGIPGLNPNMVFYPMWEVYG